MSEQSNAQAIIDTATRAADPREVLSGVFAAAVPANGSVELFDTEQYETNPRRKRGSFAAHDAATFCAYVDKHGDDNSEVWADLIGNRIVGVLNSHSSGDVGGWGDHRVTYAAQLTPAWQAWSARDGQMLDQSAFAELIEDRAVDIVQPSAADMLELAQNFKATTGGHFESSKLLSSGEGQLSYREQHEAKAGRAGRLEIPKDFKLALKPFEGAETYKVTARFRYRIADGALRVGYRLERPEDVLREAFEGVVGAVAADVTQPVFRGVSP